MCVCVRMYKVDEGWVVRKPTRQILSKEPGVCFCPAGECCAHLYFKGSEKPFSDILVLPNCAWPGTVCSCLCHPPFPSSPLFLSFYSNMPQFRCGSVDT